jgi:geranylgeranyl diphosphate synthase, type I
VGGSILDSRLIGQIIVEAIQGSDFPAPLFDAVLLALSAKGKVLADELDPRWPTFVFASSNSVRGNHAAAVRIAAAVEIMIAALDVLDEVEDDDTSELIAAVGPSRSINTSTALISLSYTVLADIYHDSVPFAKIPAFIQVMSASVSRATIGQDADLSPQHHGESVATALNIARMKAGALVGGACRLGAMTGSGEAAILDLFERWGTHYGAMAQLANDLHDATDGTNKSDILKKKKTLPLIYHYASSHDAEQVAPDEQSLRDNGTYHFVWTVIEAERQFCRDILSELSGLGFDVNELAGFLS